MAHSRCQQVRNASFHGQLVLERTAAPPALPARSATSAQPGPDPVTISPAETDTITSPPSRRGHCPLRDGAGHSLAFAVSDRSGAPGRTCCRFRLPPRILFTR